MSQNKKLIVSYQKNFSNDGTVYTQTITISKSFLLFLAQKINEEIKSGYINCGAKEFPNSGYTFGDKLKAKCYLKNLETSKRLHFLTLTQLRFIYPYLNFNFDASRVKTDRNTILKVI